MPALAFGAAGELGAEAVLRVALLGDDDVAFSLSVVLALTADLERVVGLVLEAGMSL